MRTRSEAPFSERVARVWAGLDEVVQMADDPDLTLSEFFQVTPEQLRAWRAAEGRHRCPGKTTRGHGCRNHASAMVDYDPRIWAARDPSFCPTHKPSNKTPAQARSDLSASAPTKPASGKTDAAGPLARFTL